MLVQDCERPRATDAIVQSLINALLAHTTLAVPALTGLNEQARNNSALGYQSELGSVLREGSPAPTSRGITKAVEEEAPPLAFEALLDATFDILDTDGDGFLTSSDFCSRRAIVRGSCALT